MLEFGTRSVCVARPEPNFMISNPVSIRPSQFPMNITKFDDTIAKDDVQSVERSFKEIQLSPSKTEVVKVEDDSLIIVEDTEDLSVVCKSGAGKIRQETLQNSFNNRFATNPKLNDTVSAVKDNGPFDIHVQMAFLDEIDFLEYIKGLDYVNIVERVGAIELNTQLKMGNETFDIVEQIGKGSFGFVYR